MTQRRDRTGELIDVVDDDLHACDRGWLDRDADQPRPCARCRPWLAAPTPRPPRDDELQAVRHP